MYGWSCGVRAAATGVLAVSQGRVAFEPGKNWEFVRENFIHESGRIADHLQPGEIIQPLKDAARRVV